MIPKITKIIIPAAGLGTRFLPITKSIPKEMLPLDNKPALHHVVQEAVDAGINQVNIIISPSKESIINYFAKDAHLENILASHNKSHLLADLAHIVSSTNFQYSIQDTPRGVGHALLTVQNFISSGEFFAMSYPDDIIVGQRSELANLIQVAQEHTAIIFALTEIPKEKISSYGVITPGKMIDNNIIEIKDFAEKPTPENAPSNLAIVGRFILHHDLFKYLQKLTYTTNQETIWFDAIKMMIKDGYKVVGFKIQGQRFDTGTPQGWAECVAQFNKKQKKI
jgi:UTP--glucose-1-phosphate uridylyltransferase